MMCPEEMSLKKSKRLWKKSAKKEKNQGQGVQLPGCHIIGAQLTGPAYMPFWVWKINLLGLNVDGEGCEIQRIFNSAPGTKSNILCTVRPWDHLIELF